MSWLVWISVGIATGIVAHSPIRRAASAVFIDAALGLIGAASAGWLFNTVHGIDPLRLTLNSLLLALLGAVVLVSLYHAMTPAHF
jgi:uncharacterized membrane protein YeaQ/YmgE (transglycosylase-associated protein family)